MLVEINLLPEKEKRDVTNILIIVIAGLLLVAVLQFLLTSYQSTQDEVARLEEEIMETQIKSAEIQTQLTVESRNDYEDLLETVHKMEEINVPASQILNQLVSLLPERGYFSTYNYTYGGNISFNAYFDIIDDAAAYASALDATEIIESVTISSIDTVNLLEDDIDFQFNGYLPRYVANFQLKLDKAVLQEWRNEP